MTVLSTFASRLRTELISRLRLGTVVLATAALLFSGCSDDAAPPAAPALIGAEGGLVDLGSGVTLQIPAGALSAPTDITARFDASGGGVSDEFRVGAVLVLEPAGLSFALPARVSFSAEGTSATPGELLVLTQSSSGGLELLSGSSVGSSGSVSGSLNRLAPVWLSRRGQRAAAFELSLPSATLRAGDRITLQIEATNLAGARFTPSDVSLSSSDPSVVSVGEGATLTAAKLGTATITATLHGLTATATIEVIEGALARLEIRPSELTVPRRDSVTLGVDGFDAGGNPVAIPSAGAERMRWSSSDESIARVSEGGVVRGLGSGSAQVTAATPSVRATASVEVPAPIPTTLRIVSQAPSVRLEETRRVSAQTLDEFDEVMVEGVPEISWAIRDEGVASLSTTSGSEIRLEGLALGTTWLVASSSVGADSVEVTVTAGLPAQLAFTTEPSASSTAGTAFAQQPVVEIQDAQGNRVTTATDNVTLALTTGAGTLSGTTTVAAVDGVATFSGLSINLVGTDKVLTASSGSLTSATTGAFAITAGPASSSNSTFTSSAASVTADGNSTATLTVTVADPYNNVVSGVPVFFATDLGTLSLGPWTTNASGIATATLLSSTTAGTATVSAYLGTDATGPAITPDVTISFTAGAASQLAFTTQPSASTAAGTAFAQQPVVEIQDAQGNRVTTATDNVTLTLTTGAGTLSGTTTVAAVNGVATFSGLSINLGGADKVLTASSGSLTSATTSAFAITAAPLASNISAGEYHTCSIVTVGTAYCWGRNNSGELGHGTTTSTSSPVAVTGGLTFSSISAGALHTCGITTVGAAYCWGRNSYGQLGDGTRTTTSSPVAVTGGLTFSSISAGGYHTCGNALDGATYCWGRNSNGQLGDGTTTTTSSPVAVTGGLTFSSISAGGAHTCGITTGGAAYCWGSNNTGQLGHGTTASTSSPVAVTGGLTFSSISAGTNHTCGNALDGATYCWGRNFSGQLGHGTTADTSSPVAVTGGLTFSSISVGANHTCGNALDGATYCWGNSSSGQIGDGTTTTRLAPVRVGFPP